METKEIEQKQMDIICAAQSAFAEYGFRKVTMGDIARHLDISRSALYYYYKNKEELFAAVLEHELALYEKELGDLIEQAGTPEEKLVAFGATYVYLRSNFINMYKLTYQDMSVSHDIINRFRSRVLSLHGSTIARILKKDEALARVSHVNAISQMLSMSLRGVVFNSADMTDERLRRDLVFLCKIFYNGLRSMPEQQVKNGE
ncbi:MAG: TetR/AcrR family transcriptional regulator [Spirochaetes bacterium]|nr:TetR/AcrR family transcriptional regulator [Spirochaetota bacterium]